MIKEESFIKKNDEQSGEPSADFKNLKDYFKEEYGGTVAYWLARDWELILKLSENEKKDLRELLINKIADVLADGDTNGATELFCLFTSLSDYEKEKLATLETRSLRNNSENHYFDLILQHQRLIDLHLLKEDDMTLVLERYINTASEKLEQRFYNGFQSMSSLFVRENTGNYTVAFRRHFMAAFQNIFKKLRKDIELHNDYREQRKLPITGVFASFMVDEVLYPIFDGLYRETRRGDDNMEYFLSMVKNEIKNILSENNVNFYMKEAQFGDRFEKYMDNLLTEANRLAYPVEGKFNNRAIVVRPHDNPEGIIKRFDATFV